MAFETYSYFLTETAEMDIDNVFEYITNDLLNPAAAASFADELEEKLNQVCRTPKSGSLVENEYLTRKDVRRILVRIVSLSKDEREELFLNTAQKTGIPLAIVKKDFRVCYLFAYALCRENAK